MYINQQLPGYKMVDPNRNLSKDQLTFLRECEEEFKHRYTEADPKYRSALTRENDDPPIISPWKESRSQGRGGYNNNNRGYQHRGGGGHKRRYN